MDKCHDIRDLILTDYIDNQLEGAIKERLERHLRQCSACQAFAKEVKNDLVRPFEKASRQEVPEHLWSNIQEKILQQGHAQEGFLDRLREWVGAITLPRLIPAVCSFAMLVFVGSMVFFHQQTTQARDQEQVLYLASVLNSAGTMGHTGSKDFGTPIETYFL